MIAQNGHARAYIALIASSSAKSPARVETAGFRFG